MRGYTMNPNDYVRRLQRIEGQVRGLRRMIENGGQPRLGTLRPAL